MATQHVWYALLFLLGTLAIWALLGGAICRMAAVQFARDERIGWRDAVTFARQRYFSGFALVPLLPVLMVLFAGLLLFLGGMFLRIPWLGDILGSLFFVLAIIGGGVIAAVTIGTIAGGSLFWPTIAAEGSESLDAVSRSFNYVGNTPWRTLFYGLVAIVYGSLCFLLVRAFAYLTLAATHAFVGYGTAPFGWWLRDGVPKLDRLWSAPALGQLVPQPMETTGIESFSGAVIGLWVFLVLLLVWAFLASFYFCGSTVIYFLLRRDNDAMDLEDVFIDKYEEGDHAAAAPPPASPPASPPPSTAGVQLTVDGKPSEAAAPPATADPPDKDDDNDKAPADADKAE
ncbi:MAG: hypothetical protein IID40_12020 [Planctomycetes bacterium]|nr:hypothetical protein [Planctomycetota bacterium]